VLVQSCDEFQESNANGFLRVFLTFLTCLRRWQGGSKGEDSCEEPQQSKTILEQLLEYKRCLEVAENLEDDEPLEEEINEKMFTSEQSRSEEEPPEEEESKLKKAKPSVMLAVAVLERSLHFLPSKDEQRQILVLDILTEGVLVLRSEEDHLLPIVHKIWSPLVRRFQASETRPLVIHRAFVLLSTLGNTARDFIRSRTLKQVLPSLCKILQDSASQSLLKDSGSAYRLTQLYKLQRTLLDGLGQLALDLSVQERRIYDILEAAKEYLSVRQPAPLQELCQSLYRQLAFVHRDLVWLQLSSVWSPVSELRHPSSEFCLIKVSWKS
ncbi:TELO2-interacting protein 1 homolog, partial [Homalodisca vitripennis]|uniref:TELO2-interacting protein 1 homolog n=1 Tax=Homalodisca vitripennis TaxID=197043 RepID=UPI001EE9DC3C